jgi:D-glycero-D-manno-heptose 1,7-bisphosphate phosphatase
MKKAVFLDRDGVINRKAPEGQYVTHWEEMEFLPGVHEAVRLFNHSGFFVVVASNQRCVARGLIMIDELEFLHARMRREFEAVGARLDAIYYCPHDYDPPCACRKPQPGMFLDAAREHEIDLNRSWMIGDSGHDMEAGRAAGCRTVLLTKDDKSIIGSSDLVASSLLDAAHKILQIEAMLQPLISMLGKA